MWSETAGEGKTDGPAEGRSTAAVLRRIADVLDATGFLDEVSEPPVSRT